MIKYEDACPSRQLKNISIECDFTVVGGGLAGVCAAIAAARNGLKTVIIQDRPVLGGNASSEMRLWALGATSHQGNNNRFAREGGILDELLVENMWRNPEGNPVIFDMVLIDAVRAESNITLLLNTSMCEVRMERPGKIAGVEAICFQNSTGYSVSSPLFCDASGDGILSYMAGASFRHGSESLDTYGEKLYLGSEYSHTLGHSLFFYSKKADHPVTFVAPDLALKDISVLPKCHKVSPGSNGLDYWWIEFGGDRDTVHETENIKFELWSIVYGIWNHIKNSGEFADTENLTLEWVGLLPAKRESRRFNGLYTLVQDDIISQRHFPDIVAHGGWAIDLHPDRGVYSAEPSCRQFHSKGIYGIPYRCLVSKDVENLFLGGRTVSVSHIAFGSVRVMATLAHCAQAIGTAAALCRDRQLLPAEIYAKGFVPELQDRLAVQGQGVPFMAIRPGLNKLSGAAISATSELSLGSFPADGPWRRLNVPAAQILPLEAGVRYSFTVQTRSEDGGELAVSLRFPSKPENFTPDIVLEEMMVHVPQGEASVSFSFGKAVPESRYAFICFGSCPGVEIRQTKERVSGILSVFHGFDESVAKSATQIPPENSGIETFDFWLPERRPGGANIALGIDPPVRCFGPENIADGYIRPYMRPRAFAASLEDAEPVITVSFDKSEEISRITLFFDNDYDHALESVHYGHPERVMPFCVRAFKILDAEGNVIVSEDSNHQTRRLFVLERPVVTSVLKIVLERPSDNVPASLFQVVVQ